MTDNDWRNARIEEAAKAIREVREVVIPRGDGYVSVTDADDATLARAALAVFEKALGEATVTPTAHEVTTDERARVLAILSDMDYNDGGMMRWSSGRPTEQAEKVADRIVAELSGFRRSEVPEPSARCPKCGVTVTDQTPSTFYINHDETCGGPLEEPQGDPSDAQVLAAFNTFFGLELPIISEGTAERMRAALRAAGGS